jgi:hypothetical protein
MDETLTEPTPIREATTPAPELELRGLGFALSAAAVRALLAPETRPEAEVVVDLSALSIRVPAAVVCDLLGRVAPGVQAHLAVNQVTVRSPGLPAVRVTTPAAGIRVRVDGDGLEIGGDEPLARE